LTKNVVVIGAGIIGLCTALHVRQSGHRVTVVTRDQVGDGASAVNAGAIATAEILPMTGAATLMNAPKWLFDPLGPLHVRLRQLPSMTPWGLQFLKTAKPSRRAAAIDALSRLMAPAAADHQTLLREHGLTELLQQNGGLFVYKSAQARASDSAAWAARQARGIIAHEVDREEIQTREPAMGDAAHCGYFVPGWSHYRDPQELVISIAEIARKAGVVIEQGRVISIDRQDDKPSRIELDDGRAISFDDLVIAAGAWSGELSANLGDKCPLQSQRGYNTTLPRPGVDLNTFVTFSEDHFVASPMAMGLRIGGAVEFGGLDAEPNFERSRALLKLAGKYLPGLDTTGGTYGDGHRPSTPDDVPVIGRSPNHSNVYYGFGHGHLGLTYGPTTGRLIAEMIDGKPSIDLVPYRIDRF